MFALLTAFSASICAAFSNLCFRKNSEDHPEPYIYLFFFYLTSFLVSFLTSPSMFSLSINWRVFTLGGVVGMLNVAMMLLTAKALQRGPSGLTFGFQNASFIFPNVILFLLFGEGFGFIVTNSQLIGMGFVLFGLGLSSFQNSGSGLKVSLKWFKYAIGCFLAQVLILSLFQWRCLLFQSLEHHALIPFHYKECDDAFFMPGFFGTALFYQAAMMIRNRASPSLREFFFGGMSGLTNGTCTFLLLLSTKIASPYEKEILFPFFAISVIFMCHIWASLIYKERTSYTANALCLSGIIIASS